MYKEKKRLVQRTANKTDVGTCWMIGSRQWCLSNGGPLLKGIVWHKKETHTSKSSWDWCLIAIPQIRKMIVLCTSLSNVLNKNAKTISFRLCKSHCIATLTLFASTAPSILHALVETSDVAYSLSTKWTICVILHIAHAHSAVSPISRSASTFVYAWYQVTHGKLQPVRSHIVQIQPLQHLCNPGATRGREMFVRPPLVHQHKDELCSAPQW